MRVSVKLHAGLVRRGHEGGRERVVDLEDGGTVRSVLGALEVPLSHAKVVFVNSRHASPDTPVCEGDALDVFPAIGGG